MTLEEILSLIEENELGRDVFLSLFRDSFFIADIERVLRALGANIKIIFGNAKDWAEYLGNVPFDNSAYIYITIEVEGDLK